MESLLLNGDEFKWDYFSERWEEQEADSDRAACHSPLRIGPLEFIRFRRFACSCKQMMKILVDFYHEEDPMTTKQYHHCLDATARAG